MEAINDQVNGYLVPSEDAETAAERIASLLDSPDRSREMGEAARRTIETQFTVKKMIDELTSLYTSLLTGQNRQ